jgi:hypothetical protein
MTKEEEFYISIGNNVADAEQSHLFGKPCFKIDGKAFVCFFQNEMVFKLTGESHSEALSLDGSQLFDPSGKKRPMKKWVQVPYDYSDKWMVFAIAAQEYVMEG